VLLGDRGRPGYAFPGADTLTAAHRFTLTDVRRVGPDIRAEWETTAEPTRWEAERGVDP
jgi:riboflavin biosynthesis pyrimidine reductase